MSATELPAAGISLTMEEHRTGKPWYRLRNIVLFLLFIVLSIAGVQLYRALGAVPGKSVDYGQKLTDLAWSINPGATEKDNAAELITKAVELRDRAIEAVAAANPEFNRSMLDFSLAYTTFDPANPGATGNPMDTQENFDQRRAFALQALAKYREMGVFDTLAEAATKSVYVRPKVEGHLIDMLLPDLGACRDFARANAARMRLAESADDQGDFVAAAEQSLGLARLCTTEPIIISNLVGVAISALTVGEVRRALSEGDLKPETLRALGAAFDRQGRLYPMSHALRGEELSTLDIIQWTHTDDGNGDGRRIVSESMKLREWTGDQGPKPVTKLVNLAAVFYPTKKEITAKTKELYSKMEELADMPVQERRKVNWDASQAAGALAWNYDVLKLILPALGRATVSADLAAAELAGMRVWIAVEQFRAERGSLPKTLEELVPEYLPGLPVDPYAADGKFRYRVLAAPDAQKRTYLVYSVGYDGKDDNGNEELSATPAAGQPAALQSTDLIINRRDNKR